MHFQAAGGKIQLCSKIHTCRFPLYSNFSGPYLFALHAHIFVELKIRDSVRIHFMKNNEKGDFEKTDFSLVSF